MSIQWRKSLKKEWLTVGIFALLVMQFAYLCIFNLSKSEMLLDGDFAMEFRHVVEMWKNRTLSLDNWSYVSTLEIDTPVFFAAPIYLLTSNISLSLGIAHSVFAMIVLLTVLDIYRNSERPLWEALLGALLLFTPYAIAAEANNLDYNHMLFTAGGQYQFRVLTVFLLLDVVACKKHKKRNIFSNYIFCFFVLDIFINWKLCVIYRGFSGVCCRNMGNDL